MDYESTIYFEVPTRNTSDERLFSVGQKFDQDRLHVSLLIPHCSFLIALQPVSCRPAGMRFRRLGGCQNMIMRGGVAPELRRRIRALDSERDVEERGTSHADLGWLDGACRTALRYRSSHFDLRSTM